MKRPKFVLAHRIALLLNAGVILALLCTYFRIRDPGALWTRAAALLILPALEGALIARRSIICPHCGGQLFRGRGLFPRCPACKKKLTTGQGEQTMSETMTWAQRFPMNRRPGMEDVDRFADNLLWPELRQYLKDAYGAEPRMEFSRCGLEPGWNLKFKKGSRALTTVYIRPGFVTAMIAISPREETAAEGVLLTCTEETRTRYRTTETSKMGRWLMIDLTSPEALEDIRALLAVRVKPAGK